MSIFRNKAVMLPDPGKREEQPMFIGSATEPPFAVQTAQTPDMQRQVAASNYPRHDWGDVRHTPRVRRGFGY